MDKHITWKSRQFGELDTQSLYDILALRAEVFVVEQHCVYNDPDGEDLRAMHITATVDGELAAYSRVFAPGDRFAEAAIGRVVVRPCDRGRGLGHELMEVSLHTAARLWGPGPVAISAQRHLERFYNAHGFAAEGEPYLEDGIPHVHMKRG